MPRFGMQGGDATDCFGAKVTTDAAIPDSRVARPVFGLGYVGIASAACPASCGHSVIGVDVSAEKVDMVNQGRRVVNHAEVCVVGAADPEAIAALGRVDRRRIVIDLVRFPGSANYDDDPRYIGISW